MIGMTGSVNRINGLPGEIRPGQEWNPNDVGIHEFMRLCELLDTEPYIAVNAGLGGVKEAADEVEYCNGTEDTPMGKWRKQNGQAKPWKVKWWSVGNEMFGGLATRFL